MKLPFVTYKQAAEILGLTEASLRQRVERGSMPAPVAIGPRLYVFPRAQIELIATGSRHTLFLDQVSPASEKLHKRIDVTVDGAGQEAPIVNEPQYFHVRIYTPADRSYEVVVIGRMKGTVMLPAHRIETVAGAVLPLVKVPVDQTFWVTVDPGYGSTPNLITAETLSYGTASTDQTGPDRGYAGEGTYVFEDADSREIDFAELVALLGQAPEWHEAHAYTRDVVDYWQRNERPKPVTVDPKGMIPLVTAIGSFGQVRAECEHFAVARLALRFVSHELRRREQHPTFSAPSKVPAGATIVTSVDRPFTVDHDGLPAVAGDDLQDEELPDLVRELRAWRRQVDEYSEHPDAALTAAIDQTLALAVLGLRRAAWTAGRSVPAELEFDEPERVRGSKIAGAWDQQWLRGLRQIDPADQTFRRQRAILDAQSSSITAYLVDDVTGAVAGVEDPQLSIGSRFSYLVTTRPVAFVPADRIVADGAPGHRALYLKRASGELQLLPEVRSENYRDMWNFGYSGGAPGFTANDVAIVLTANGVLGIDDEVRQHIDEVFCDARFRDGLDVSLAVLVPGFAEG